LYAPINNWVVSTLKDASRAPSETEWNMLVNGPLDGEIGMSFALQWRYNFGRIFNGVEGGEDELVDDDSTEQ